MRALIFTTTGAIVLSGCMAPAHRSDEVVEQTYIHRYGVEVTPKDWNERGGSGTIVAKRRDGVVVTTTFFKEKRHGESTYTFPYSDLIQKTEMYEQDRLVKETDHYTTGLPKVETAYMENNERIVTTWFDGGGVWTKEHLVDGRLSDAEYYTIDGKLEARVSDGYGNRMNRDAFGNLMSRDEIQDGGLGNRTTFHPNGNPKESIPYVADAIDGLKRTFLPDGEPNTIEEWQQGKQHGMTTLFQNGERIAEIPYLYGVKEGIERRFSSGEKVVEEITWVAGSKHGAYNTYVGNKVQTDWYHQGKRVNKATYDFLSGPVRTNS